MSGSAEIRPLPAAAIRSIRSAAAVPDVCAVAVALLENSIDAGATCVRVHVCLEQFSVQVKDNGRGVPQGGFERLGQRHMTSKHGGGRAPSGRRYLGYRGEALADMSTVGSVHVTTRAGGGRARRCLIRDGVQLAAGDCAADDLGPYNTAVKVDDMFGAFPVRRRAMAESAQKTAGAVRAQLQRYALCYPDIALCLVAGPSDAAAALFSYAAAASVNQRVAQIHGPRIAQALDFVSADHGGWSLHGSISRAPILARVQQVFVDGRPCGTAELAATARHALGTSEYTDKANTAPGSGESVRSPRAQHPAFVLLISGTRAAAAGEVVTADMRRLVVLACIKFLRRFGMASDGHMQACMARAACGATRKRPPDARPGPAAEPKRRGGSAVREARSDQRRPAPNGTGIEAPIPRAPRYSGGADNGSGSSIDVASLRVIGQADQKYIMCQGGGGLLVAIDQHAADERVRLEAHFGALCAMLQSLGRLGEGCAVSAAEGVSVLVPPAPAALSAHDGAAVEAVAGGLRRLGIQLAPRAADPAGAGDGDGERVLHIVCAPTVLVPRLAGRDRSGGGGGGSGGGFARELLLAAADWLASGGSTAGTGTGGDTAEAWPALAALPSIVIDTVRSVACRSAITFNEALDLGACQALVARLARCRFPWFCAHGRRSVAPIARLGGGGGGGRRPGERWADAPAIGSQ
ncbi:DNA mismatch repair protein [Coemansia javaensis]|uniref:DNA mismatch repair protein n=1 Tax=Coemansia javaensis TaxID=2761396 RepID=A0A9W8HGC1_9FUNG|nr:DNA mismatch repair protein [Coemansia javaensis]